MNIKSGELLPNAAETKLTKNTSLYWQSAVYKPVNTAGVESPYYSMRLQFKESRLSFATGTVNKDQAAMIARNIYKDLITTGVEATLAKWHPKNPATPKGIATVGEFLIAAAAVSTVSAGTFASYARCFRSIAAQIAATERTKKRLYHGNAAHFRKEVDGISLDLLTEEAIQKWRKQFVAGKKPDPASQKKARISCNSVLRQAKTLFSEKKILRYLKLELPSPVPFARAEFFSRDSMRYQSEIEAKTLLRAAVDELRGQEPEVYKVVLLALGAGLRRNEMTS